MNFRDFIKRAALDSWQSTAACGLPLSVLMELQPGTINLLQHRSGSSVWERPERIPSRDTDLALKASARDGRIVPDPLDEASEESFPSSDAWHSAPFPRSHSVGRRAPLPLCTWRCPIVCVRCDPHRRGLPRHWCSQRTVGRTEPMARSGRDTCRGVDSGGARLRSRARPQASGLISVEPTTRTCVMARNSRRC